VLAIMLAASTGCGGQPVEAATGFSPVANGQGLEPPWWAAPAASQSMAVESEGQEADDDVDLNQANRAPIPEPPQWMEIRVPTDVLFDVDSAVISEHGLEVLADVIDEYRLMEAGALTVAGATDSTGTYEHNLGLSLRRAEAAKQALATAGVTPSIIQVEAWADTRPVKVDPSLDELTARSLQRRIELRVLTQSKE